MILSFIFLSFALRHKDLLDRLIGARIVCPAEAKIRLLMLETFLG